MRGRWRCTRDDGSSLAEFVMTVAVLAPLLLTLLQIGVVLHVRNTLRAEAAEGARMAAAVDRTPEDGATRAEDLARASFGALQPHAEAGNDTVDGVPVVWVRLTAQRPLIGWLETGAGTVSVTAHALDER
jgi:Flp pilus assembly protein TadG